MVCKTLHIIDKSLRDLMLPSVRFRRLKPTVNNVPSLRDLGRNCRMFQPTEQTEQYCTSRKEDTLPTACFNLRSMKSRRDNTLITAGFNLRQKFNAPQVPQGRHLGIDNVPSLRDLMLPSVRFRRLKPTVNKVPSLRDLVMTLNY